MKTIVKTNNQYAKLAQRVLCVFLTLGLAMPAQARWLESAETIEYSYQGEKKPTSTWQRLQKETKKTVEKWWVAINKQVEVWSGKETGKTSTASTAPSVPAAGTTAVVAPAPTSSPVPAPAVSPTPAPAPVAGAMTEEQKQYSAAIGEAKEKLSGKDWISVAAPGRTGTSVLPKTRVGVPVFALSRTEVKKDKTGKKRTKVINVSEIPRLDIGLEKTISKNDLIPPQLTVGLKKHSRPQELASPKVFSQKTVAALKQRKLPVIAKAQPPRKGTFQLGQIVTQKRIEAVPLSMEQTKVLQALKPVKTMTADDLKMIAAVTLYEKGEMCHMAAGLFTDLADKKLYAEEANFYLGVCAHQMGFHSEAVSRLLEVVRIEHKEFIKDAITNLVEDLPREYDVRVAAALKQLKRQDAIDEKARDNANFVLARAAHTQDQFAEAAQYAAKVREKSTRYPEARYLLGIAQYAENKFKESEKTLLDLRAWMLQKNVSDKNLEALIAVNVARMRFTQGRYQAAHEEYMRVPKDHPVWVQALIEQGWTQLNTEDPAGAIGNMYSLHSPYFKSVFMPESWVVRTIGYIDICQYGDAYRTLTKMEQLHARWLDSVNRYTGTKKSPSDYYTTVRNYIQGRSDLDVDGLPHQIIREIARQRGFLNVQNALNGLEDEITQYTFIYNLVKKTQGQVATRMQQAKGRLAKIKQNLIKAKTTPELVKFVPEWTAQKRNEEALVTAYEFQTQIFEQSRKGYLQMKTIALSRIDNDKKKMRLLAGKELMSHMKDIRSRIAQLIEGNEFLRYEIFSGSGENIRYQVSGGATADTKRIPANVKPQKILNWEFDGEYWEDEIGSYRSTLKNNCPNSRAHSSVPVIDGGQKTAKID